MKRIIILIVLSTSVLFAFSQNTELLHKSCLVVLKNNKTINDAKIWAIQSDKIEYEKEGSLHDLLKERIKHIETTDGKITFDETGKAISTPWNLIIRNNGDTIRCTITWVSSQTIGYRKPDSKTTKSISKTLVKKYIRNNKEVVLKNKDTQSGTPPSVVVKTEHKPYQTTSSVKPISAFVPYAGPGLVTGELFAGIGMGAVGALGGGVVGGIFGLGSLISGKSDVALALGVVGVTVGYTIGTAGGVHMAGTNKQVTGRYGSAVGGAIGGIVAGGAIIGIGAAAESDGLLVLGVLTALAAPPIGATIAYNNSRKYRNSNTKPNLSLGINPSGASLTYKF